MYRFSKLSLLLFAVAAVAVSTADDSLVNTPLGSVQGIVGEGWRLFAGVPFATPPVGALRWNDPLPVQPWAPNTLNATQDPPGCWQDCYSNEPPHICPPVHSEDCLYLNIWTPRMNGTITKPLPVIIFYHGGNFMDGYAGGLNPEGGLLYDGRSFVTSYDVIIVVAQYRLGNLGFLYLGSDTGIQGNYGLKDQVQSMAWVKEYISYFGGDPNSVTLSGQSAGSMSISAHLSRLETSGLYNQVIMVSNPFAEAYRDPFSALDLANVFANFSGCNYADLHTVETCLRALSPETLLHAQILSNTDVLADITNFLQIVVTWSPTIGTEYLPRRPLEAFQAGEIVDVPIIVGTTANETVIFVYEVLDFPLSQPLYELAASLLIGPEDFNKSLALYPYPDPLPSDLRVFASYLLTDGLFLCPTRNASEALLANQPYRRSPIYHYQYSHQLVDSASLWQSNFTECWTSVCHGSDLPLIFRPNDPNIANYTTEEAYLSSAIQNYWVNFATTGNPNANNYPQSPTWPTYNANTRNTINFEVASKGGITILEGIRASYCQWWDDVVGYHVY